MSVLDVKIPDIGDYKDVPVVEIHVKPGDVVKVDDPLLSIESDKATMDIPAPVAGRVEKILVKIGDKVSEGRAIVSLETPDAATATAAAPANTAPPIPTADTAAESDMPSTPPPPPDAPRYVNDTGHGLPPPADFGGVYASPSVRRLARELDIDLTRLEGTGDKGRITKDDVKRALSPTGAVPAPAGTGIPPIPPQDFAKFGAIETRPLSRLKKLAGPHLHRAWLNIPHVTHTDQADITELDAYRKTLDANAKDKGYRVTLLAFLLKASLVALKEYPDFNASLAPDGQALILKHYYNIGVAVDTPDGLVVPVIKDVDRKGILELSQELSSVSQRMRDGKITPSDIQGGTFSISSLGGIGGTGFTPIVNAPEVAILGVVRAALAPVWDGKAFQARLMLPLCLSYDHRVIDGALAARFTRRLAELLTDVRQLVL